MQDVREGEDEHSPSCFRISTTDEGDTIEHVDKHFVLNYLSEEVKEFKENLHHNVHLILRFRNESDVIKSRFFLEYFYFLH